jgi:DNA repair exonuclease SbcCD ATPase subunit
MSDAQKPHELDSHDPKAVGASDIVFDCPACHKSLVVDHIAAGHEMPCPVCGKTVKVPVEHHVVTLSEAPETQKLQAMPEWRQQLIAIEGSLKEAQHQRQEAGNFYKQHLSEANRQKLRMDKLDARIKELETQRAAIKAQHPG